MAGPPLPSMGRMRMLHIITDMANLLSGFIDGIYLFMKATFPRLIIINFFFR